MSDEAVSDASFDAMPAVHHGRSNQQKNTMSELIYLMISANPQSSLCVD